MLFLREKLEAQGRELERERAAQRHLAADLNRELHNLNKQKEAEVQAVRYAYQCCGSGMVIPDRDFFPSNNNKKGKNLLPYTNFIKNCRTIKLKISLVLNRYRRKN